MLELSVFLNFFFLITIHQQLQLHIKDLLFDW